MYDLLLVELVDVEYCRHLEIAVSISRVIVLMHDKNLNDITASVNKELIKVNTSLC